MEDCIEYVLVGGVSPCNMRLISNMFVVAELCIAIVDCTHVRHGFQKYEHVYHILLLHTM